MATTVRVSHFHLKLNNVFTENRRQKRHNYLPIIYAFLGIDVFICKYPIIVADRSSFCERLLCDASHVREKCFFKGKFIISNIETTFVCEKNDFVHVSQVTFKAIVCITDTLLSRKFPCLCGTQSGTVVYVLG